VYKIIFFFCSINISLFAYIDSDMDGVPDENDKCANTALIELVDLSGCSIKKLVSEHHFDMLLGQSYSKENNSDLSLSSIRMDYYYKKWSFQLATSYYNSTVQTQSKSGQSDSYLNVFYLFKPLKNLYLNLGAGLVFPTYDNPDNKLDYTFSLYGQYKWDKLSFIFGIGYGKTGDSNSDKLVSYNNSISYNVGIGYLWNAKLYSSIEYTKANSIFEGLKDLENISLYSYYSIDEHYFASINYSYGLLSRGKKQSIGVSFGYYW